MFSTGEMLVTSESWEQTTIRSVLKKVHSELLDLALIMGACLNSEQFCRREALLAKLLNVQHELTGAHAIELN